MPKYSITDYRMYYDTQLKTNSYIQGNTQYFDTTKYYPSNIEYYLDTPWVKMYGPPAPDLSDFNFINRCNNISKNCFLVRKEMIISIEHEDEAEYEISLDLCCPNCANVCYNVPIEKF